MLLLPYGNASRLLVKFDQCIYVTSPTAKTFLMSKWQWFRLKIKIFVMVFHKIVVLLLFTSFAFTSYYLLRFPSNQWGIVTRATQGRHALISISISIVVQITIPLCSNIVSSSHYFQNYVIFLKFLLLGNFKKGVVRKSMSELFLHWMTHFFQKRVSPLKGADLYY